MNFEKTLSLIRQAAHQAGRHSDEILVLPTVKGQGIEVFQELRKAGLLTVGENRVQEFVVHHGSTESMGFKWHFIGQLQSNKVKYIVGKCDLIQSLDRASLAQELNKRSQQIGIITDCLIELNIISEPNKGGLKLDADNILQSGKSAINNFLDEIKDCQNLRIRGLMAVMPDESLTVLETYYESLGALFKHFKKEKGFDILSAGMSNDFHIAIKHGATIIRIGRALFEN